MKKKKVKSKIKLKISKDDPDVAYLKLPSHPGKGKPNIVKETIRLSEHIPNYKGADLYLDIDQNGEVIGIEIML